ncbi:MAG: MlaE family lipid ABC transporter permease subunit [Deltaproteobacteria bacterium]|nr:MAG: MlaE family lipid ABC transporter permease subunit [Deltaproteobacteria bacterium]
MPPAFGIEQVQTSADQGEIRIHGSLRFAEAAPLWTELRRLETSAARGQTLNFEMSAVQRIDGGAMALLACLRAELQRRGVKSEFVAADAHVQRIIHLYGGDHAVARLKRRRPLGTLDQLGRATISILLEVKLVLAFFGQMVVAGAGVLRSPRSANWRELPATMERSGADAVPVILLINFLVGVAMAFQSAAQLKQFGANILVADLIGISICRELGPLMTAIVVCGRSGAAFAAELGFMQVNEEIDALRTMGFGPMRYLVLPRALALILVVPLLTLLADVAGVLGGLVVGVTSLDLTVRGYLNQTARVVSLWDISSGVIKSMVFAFAVALIACQQGLATSGGAEGVGRRTTSTVVITMFTLILVDAVTTVLFRMAGL